MAHPGDNFVPDFGAADEQQPSTTPQPEQAPPTHEEVNSDGVKIRIYFPPGTVPDPNKTRPQKPLPPIEPSYADQARREDPTPLPSSTGSFEPVAVPSEPPPLIRGSGHPPPARAGQRGCSRVLFALIAIGFICLLVGGSLVAWAYFTNSLPPDMVAVVETAAYEQGIGIAIQPTHIATPTATSRPQTATYVPTPRPSVTPTSGIAVTVLPSPSTSPTRTAGTELPEEGDIVQNGAPMVHVPGGTFSMGSNEAANESPIHEVTLDPYYIDQYEVTNANYALCVEDGACPLPGSTTAYDSTAYYGMDEYSTYPVVYVSWHSADTYCQWRGARLPSEAEWEMAARWNPATGTAMAYPWGEDWDSARLNYCDASCLITDPLLVDETFDDGYPQMAPVGSFPEGVSPVGAHDMAGNVAEWVYDWYAADYYAISPEDNPIGPDTGQSRVVRGGGWSLDWLRNRTTARLPWGARSQVAGIGFRCATSADAVNP